MLDPVKLELLQQRLPGHDIELVTSGYTSLYNDYRGLRPDVYFIFEGEGETTVDHQYGCVSCMHYRAEDCVVLAVSGDIARDLRYSIGCRPSEEQVLTVVRRFLCDATIDYPTEALTTVYSEELGTFKVARSNCD